MGTTLPPLTVTQFNENQTEFSCVDSEVSGDRLTSGDLCRDLTDQRLYEASDVFVTTKATEVAKLLRDFDPHSEAKKRGLTLTARQLAGELRDFESFAIKKDDTFIGAITATKNIITDSSDATPRFTPAEFRRATDALTKSTEITFAEETEEIWNSLGFQTRLSLSDRTKKLITHFATPQTPPTGFDRVIFARSHNLTAGVHSFQGLATTIKNIHIAFDPETNEFHVTIKEHDETATTRLTIPIATQ